MRIVSHNAFWFQGTPFDTDRPGEAVEAMLSSLAAIYRDLGPDVLAVQEVQDEGTFSLLAEATGLTGRHCPGGELGQYGGALLWRSGRFVADWRSSPLVPHRMWQIADVPAGGAGVVRVCNIHLPSSRQIGEPAAGPRRGRELRDALARGGQPGVVLGDFNEQPGGAVGALLTDRGYVDAAELTGQADRPTTPGGGRGDQIWIHRSLRDRVGEYAVLDVEPLRAPQEGREFLSDHLPLWVTLET